MPIKAKKIEDVQSDDYPTHPTVQFLSSLKAQPKSKLPSYYEYVLNITPQQYSLIYKVTGLEPEFLNFFWKLVYMFCRMIKFNTKRKS